MKRFIIASVLLSVLYASNVQAYDPVADFSIADNQNVAGVWSYGQSSTLGGVFSLLPNAELSHPFDPNIESWRGTVGGFGGGFPTIAHNKSNTTQTFLTVTHPADELLFHPGPNGEYAVLRFVAPAAGVYQFQGTFTGRDSAPATTDVSIRQNLATALFGAGINVSGGGNVAAFNISPTLAAGDTIDFTVGFGDGFYGNDSTGLRLTASPAVVPEPSALILLSSIGIPGIAMLVRRRKK